MAITIARAICSTMVIPILRVAADRKTPKEIIAENISVPISSTFMI